jgi:predicted Zn-dependent peptidase
MENEGCIIASIAEPDYTRISLTCTKDLFERNFTRIIKAIKNPDFSKETLDKVKKERVSSIENNQNAYRMITDLFLKEFYRYHPYRQPILGYKNTIERLTPESTQEFYRNFYCANRLTVSVSGEINGPDILELSRKLLGDVPKNITNKVDIPWEPLAQEKKLYLVSSANSAWLFMGFPAPDVKSPDYPKMLVLSSLLGEGLSARLFIELREKEGLAYELSAQYPKLEGPSYWVIYVMTNSKNVYRCRSKVFKEIKKLKQELITNEELDAARRKVLGKILMDRESNRERAFSAAYFTALGLSSDYDRVLSERINNITAKDIQSAAMKYLENYTVLLIESSPNQFKDED